MIRKWKTSLRFELIPKRDVFGFRQHYYICLPLENLSFYCVLLKGFILHSSTFHHWGRHNSILSGHKSFQRIHLWNRWPNVGENIQAQGAEVEANPSKVCNGRFLGKPKRFRNAWKTCFFHAEIITCPTLIMAFLLWKTIFLGVKTLGATDFELIAGSSRIFLSFTFGVHSVQTANWQYRWQWNVDILAVPAILSFLTAAARLAHSVDWFFQRFAQLLSHLTHFPWFVFVAWKKCETTQRLCGDCCKALLQRTSAWCEKSSCTSIEFEEVNKFKFTSSPSTSWS